MEKEKAVLPGRKKSQRLRLEARRCEACARQKKADGALSLKPQAALRMLTVDARFFSLHWCKPALRKRFAPPEKSGNRKYIAFMMEV